MSDKNASENGRSDEENTLTVYPSPQPTFSAADNQQIPSIHSLNDDCLYDIFTYLNFVELTRISVVCYRWYNLCACLQSSTTHLKIDPMFVNCKLDKRVLGFTNVLMKTEKNLLILDLSPSYRANYKTYFQMTADNLKIIHELCPKLRCLNLSSLCITRKSSIVLSDLISPNLVRLEFRGCSLKEVWLEKILENCRNLEQLDVSCNGDITGACITKYLQKNKMRYFDLSGCYQIEESVVQFILRHYVESLEHLNISRCSIVLSTQNLCPLNSLTKFIVNGPLKFDFFQWDIGSSYTLDFIELLTLMPNLSELDIKHNQCFDWDCDKISMIPYCCPMLASLDINYICILNLESLLKVIHFLSQLSRLKYLAIGRPCALLGVDDRVNKFRVTDLLAGIVAKLECLIIKSWNISEDEMFYIIRNQPQLRELDISGTVLSTISDTDFFQLSVFFNSQSVARTTKLVIYARNVRTHDGFDEETCCPRIYMSRNRHLESLGRFPKIVVKF